MCGRASNAEPEPAGADPADLLRQAIERDYGVLLRRLAVLVYRVCGRLRREEVLDRVQEVLGEAVQRALQAASAFDPQRSATAWLMGFALRILLEQQRGARRTVVQSDLGDEGWQVVVADLCTADSAETATLRLDIRQALARLKEEQRRAIELRYFEGLDGDELAQALNAPTSGAARVRLARALQALRTAFGMSGEEGRHD
jgi:RNA polymerase sigma factor (sigma-70 family)